MKYLGVISFFILAVMVVCISCLQRYDPPVISLSQSFLVVEGNLDPGGDSTIIRLTRTFKLDDTARLKKEDNAQLAVEGRDNTVRVLTPAGNGYYVSPGLGLVIGNEYRLRIRTANGKEYLSDYVRAKLTPQIDSISWDRNDKGVSVYANTGDPLNDTRYYRWNFDETWEIRSHYYSYYIYENGIVRPRNLPEEEVYYCWKYDTSSSISLANSIRLRDDIIYRAPLTFIHTGDDRLSVRYSIQVTQYALDKAAYDFFELMKKNTEKIGSVFSPQPSEIKGNLHGPDGTDEYVLGYITASTVVKERIFIPGQWRYPEDCSRHDFRENDTLNIRVNFGNGGYMPYDYDTQIKAYASSEPECVDCRRRGGYLTKPSFW